MRVTSYQLWSTKLGDYKADNRNPNSGTKSIQRRMVGVTVIDQIRNQQIRQQTKATDVIRRVTKLKWKNEDHISRITENRWKGRIVK